MDNKDEIVSRFIDFIKNHDVPENGKITPFTINEVVPYSRRQFDRIFKEYSKYTPFEIAERFRLLCCVESIKKGNTLKETAYDYGYGPDGLSNAIRTQLNIDVKKIKQKKFELSKHIKISSLMTQLDEFKYQLSMDNFMMLFSALDSEKILKTISSENRNLSLKKEFDLHLEYKKIIDFLEKYEDLEIDKKTYEDIDSQEAIVMLAILKANSSYGYNEFSVRTEELISMFFLLNFFFNISALKLNNKHYKLLINEGLKEIFEFLKKFESVTGEPFDIILHCSIKKDKVVIEFNWVYKEMLLEINGTTN